MGFHKRHIDNEKVISMYESQGIQGVWDMYTRGVDALILETGLASQISDVISDGDWQVFGMQKMQDHVTKLILEEMGVSTHSTK
tara:strand:- start:561 stop:812 length:252 start_codon:yes stop_codon:yes gene_type:complete